MSNELTALNAFTTNLFRHTFLLLPWYCKNSNPQKYNVKQNKISGVAIKKIKSQRVRFFGDFHELIQANDVLEDFYKALEPEGSSDVNKTALESFVLAWKCAWANRAVFQFRGHETKLMKYFNEIFSGGNHVHLPELLSMARLIDSETVKTARLVSIKNGWCAKKAFAEKTQLLKDINEKVFGEKPVTPQTAKQASVRKPKAYKQFQQAVKDRRHAANIRLIDIFDEQQWFPTVDSKVLRKKLQEENLEEFLPAEFRGRIGVQPNGYPLTFYTYDELELEMPPLNDVRMNANYGKHENGKEYNIHPVSDGTFYCETSAAAGDSKVKYYTMDYKRRARHIKYDKIRRLDRVIKDVRKVMLKHVRSKDRDTRMRALMCMIIDSKYLRIGNMISATGNKKTYGITTILTKKHVQVKKNKIIIKYPGKHSQEQKHEFAVYRTQKQRDENPVESIISDRLLELIAENNKFLFSRADGKPYTPQQVNEYFTAATKPNPDKGLPDGGTGSNCTVHNLRNYHATRMFIESATDFAKKRNMASYSEVLSEYKFIICEIALYLGNTPSICRKSYVDPTEQLMFFKEWGYRPPNMLKRDVFVSEQNDHYNIEEKYKDAKPRYIYANKRAETSARRKKVKSGKTYTYVA